MPKTLVHFQPQGSSCHLLFQDMHKMDPDKKDALNSVENSIYRTAFKLRSVQSLCQLDLIDSSLIWSVLLHQSFWEARESSLPVQQLSQALQELFQRAGVEKPGLIRSRASELTLSLLTTVYDSAGTGFLKLVPVVAALIALSGDSPLTKYRALFQLYAENSRGIYDPGTRMTRRMLRNLLTDLQLIPAVVGESRALCSVESAIRSCFQGALSPAIKEEKFLSWVQSEPPILLWLPTCYRLSATEMVTHPVRCSVCRTFPITGLRYRCLKCLNFDICQVCFLSGLYSKSHQQSHRVIEHYTQMSTKESTKLLFRTLRNNLLQGRWKRKETMGRRWLLAQANVKDRPNHAPARLPIQYDSSEVPVYVRPARPVGTAAIEISKHTPQRISQAQQTDNRNLHHQTPISIQNELWRTRESINALHRERRLLKKQLNRYKDKLQALCISQEEKSGKFETKIQELTTNQDSLEVKLQQMGQDLQAVLQPFYPSSSCQNMVSKVDRSSAARFWKESDSSQIINATEDGSKWETLPNSVILDRSPQSQTNTECVLPNPGSPETILQTTRTQSQAQKMSEEIFNFLPSCKEGLLQDTPKIAPAEMIDPTLPPAEWEETVNIKESKDELEEEDLQELLSKLMNAFNLGMPSGQQSSVNTDLYAGAERVCWAFSSLIDQITMPNFK